MKKHIPAVCATLAGLSFATPSSNNFHSVTNDWYNGNFSNVYELAQMRLSTNATDVVGAYLMLDWDLAFSDYSTISNAMMRVVSSSDLVAAPAFSNAYEKCRHLYLSFCENYMVWHPGATWRLGTVCRPVSISSSEGSPFTMSVEPANLSGTMSVEPANLSGTFDWEPVRSGSYWTTDHAQAGSYPQPWTNGWKEWRIPVGWGIAGTVKGVVVPDPTVQRFEITETGTVTVRKYQHEIQRNVANAILLDGVRQN